MTSWPRIALVFAPQGEPAMPHLALPMLRGYLLARLGVSADLHDLNLAFYRQLLSFEGLMSLSRILEGKRLFARDPALRPHVARLAEEVAGALAVLDGRAFEPERYAWALDRVADACAVFSLAHDGYDLTLKNLRLRRWDGSARALRRIARERDNPFRSFLEPHVERLSGYDVVGLNLSWTGQLAPVFALARLLKRRAPGTRIVLGGSLVPHVLEGLLGARELMDDIDFVVPFEGERPLAQLVASMRDGTDPSAVEGVLSPRGRGRAPLVSPGHTRPVDPDDVETPDFTGLPIDDYLSPQACLPLATSRGCYHGRCGFCDHCHHVTAPHARVVSDVLEDLRALQGRHGVRRFFFVDDSLPVATLEGLSEALPRDPGGGARFIAGIRPEAGLTKALLERAASAGCHGLLFGLESGSQRTLNRMRKGIDLGAARRVIAEAHAAGILTWCFFMVGYPGETLEEVRDTFRLLVEQRRDIDVIAGGRFVMPRHAPVAEDGALPGLSVDPAGPDLRLTRGWHHPGSPSREDLDRVIAEAEVNLEAIYPRLASFIEAHLFAFRQDDYQEALVRQTSTSS